jgi:hypothetical protein
MNFCNYLPDDCPPDGYDSLPISDVYRILSGAAPTAYDWMTHLERGEQEKPDDLCPCRWASLSLTKNIAKSKKWPSLRNATHAAKLEIPQNAGAHIGKKHHVDFWRAETSDMNAFIVSVEAV